MTAFPNTSGLCPYNPQPFENVQHQLGRISHQYAIHFATSRLAKARRTTIEWLESIGLYFKYDLHFLAHGEKRLSLGSFAAAVEDDLDQATAFADTGIKTFVLAHPWNEIDAPPKKLMRVSNWHELADLLLALPMQVDPYGDSVVKTSVGQRTPPL